MSIVRVSINAKLRPEKHFKMEHFSETEICIAKFSFYKTFVYSSFVIWLQFHQSTKNLSSFLRKFFHAFSALLIFFSLFSNGTVSTVTITHQTLTNSKMHQIRMLTRVSLMTIKTLRTTLLLFSKSLRQQPQKKK